MRHLLFIIIPIFTLLSCKRPQSTYSSKETVRTDTFFRYREVIKTLPQKDSVVIFNPCDSLGIINRFYAQISIPNGKVEVQSKSNRIIATVVTDKTVSVNDSTRKDTSSKDSSVVEKVVVKTIIPTWIIVTLFIETMIILLYLYYRLTFYK
jgi:hypothetical protein